MSSSIKSPLDKHFILCIVLAKNIWTTGTKVELCILFAIMICNSAHNFFKKLVLGKPKVWAHKIFHNLCTKLQVDIVLEYPWFICFLIILVHNSGKYWNLQIHFTLKKLIQPTYLNPLYHGRHDNQHHYLKWKKYIFSVQNLPHKTCFEYNLEFQKCNKFYPNPGI